MEMIPSEISGVAFSLNPLNNDFDEAIISSNWGVGETVVSGVINADLFIINKIHNIILTKKLGKKEFGLYLQEQGGLIQKINQEKSEIFSLTEEQIFEILNELKKIEELYENRPVDIEWCYSNNKLHILQARPITAYLNLPKKLKTEKTENRNLYLDVSLVIQGTDIPYSVLGSSALNFIFSKLGKKVFNSEEVCDINNGLLQVIGGKIFFNLSNLFTIVDKKTYIDNFKYLNERVSEILKNLEKKNQEDLEDKKNKIVHKYVNVEIPNSLNFSKFGMLWRLPITKFLFPNFFLNRILNGVINGSQYYGEIINEYKKKWISKKITLKDLINNLVWDFSYFFSQQLIPAIFGGISKGVNKIRNLFDNLNFPNEDNERNNNSVQNLNIKDVLKKKNLTKNDLKFLIGNLTKSLPNNITTKMGLELFSLAELLACDNKLSDNSYVDIDYEDFIFYFTKIYQNYKETKMNIIFADNKFPNFSMEFLMKFQNFMEIYGIRGETELDLKNPRFSEDHSFILNQILNFYNLWFFISLRNKINDSWSSFYFS